MDLGIHLWRTGDKPLLLFTWYHGMNLCYFVYISHRFAVARALPPLDDSQDITDAVAMLSDGVTVITFTRPRNSGDSRDISLDECRFLLFAWGGSVTYGTPNLFSYHTGGRTSTPETVCFPSATVCPGKPKALISAYVLLVC